MSTVKMNNKIDFKTFLNAELNKKNKENQQKIYITQNS